MERPELLGTQLFDLSGRTALVTGAGRGLGRTMALALAAAGADVAVTARTSIEIEALAAEIESLGRRALSLTADISQEADALSVVRTAIGHFGALDILVNNAGINVRKPALELTAEEFSHVLNTNLHGYFHCARAAGRHMVEQGHGKVINISSVMGQVALPGQLA